MYTIKEVTTQKEANKIYSFLISEKAFLIEWTPGEKKLVKSGVEGSITNSHQQYWYAQENQRVIGAIGVSENEYRSGGYFLNYFSVHEDFRRLGLGGKLLEIAERYVQAKKGRYILIDSSDTAFFKSARDFYLKNGYTQVGFIPDYYAVGDGKIDYYKKM